MDKKINLIEFGNNLRAERNRRHLSQWELAELANVQMNHISRIEGGLIDIKISTLVSILQALNIKFEQLYNLNE